jgi:hypothetical protein
MAIEVDDVLRVAVRFLWDDLSDIINVWHIAVASLGTASTDTEVMEDIAEGLDAIYTNVEGAVTNRVAGLDLSGVNVTQNVLLPVVPFISAGTSAGESLPLPVSPMIQFGSATPRHGSRIFLPPFGEGTNVDGIVQAAFVAMMEDFAADVLTGIFGTTNSVAAERVAYDRSAGVARSLVSAFIPVTFRTQRRRRQGVGS